jgi:hypothetical protein
MVPSPVSTAQWRLEPLLTIQGGGDATFEASARKASDRGQVLKHTCFNCLEHPCHRRHQRRREDCAWQPARRPVPLRVQCHNRQCHPPSDISPSSFIQHPQFNIHHPPSIKATAQHQQPNIRHSTFTIQHPLSPMPTITTHHLSPIIHRLPHSRWLRYAQPPTCDSSSPTVTSGRRFWDPGGVGASGWFGWPAAGGVADGNGF